LGKIEMKRFLITPVGALLLLQFSNSAGSADPLTGPYANVSPAPAAVTNWTGCYVGVHAGAALSYDKIASSSDFGSTGFGGGGQIGCDYQFASIWVVGLEGQAAWFSLKSTGSGTGRSLYDLWLSGSGGIFGGGGIPLGVNATFPTQFTVKNDFLASASARLGYNVVQDWLAYARGGVAWTDERDDIAFTAPILGIPVDPKGTTTRTGWMAGAGAEWAFASHWSTSFAYDFFDFGGHGFFLIDSARNVTFRGNLKDRIQTLTIGLNYRL
jgi:outer membrane immunogenic protein